MKLTIKDPWKPNRPTVIDHVTLTRAVITRPSHSTDADEYAIVFKAQDGRQFAITGVGTEIGALVQALCAASIRGG